MKMFLLGMLSMHFVVSFVAWWADTYCAKDWLRVKDFFKITYVIYDFLLSTIIGIPTIMPYIPLCIKYRINPFRTKPIEIADKLDDAGKEKWISLAKTETEKKCWKEVLYK